LTKCAFSARSPKSRRRTLRTSYLGTKIMCLKYDCNRSAPRDGAYVHGLFMEGARWDVQAGVIMDSRLKDLFPPMPVINIRVIL